MERNEKIPVTVLSQKHGIFFMDKYSELCPKSPFGLNLCAFDQIQLTKRCGILM